MPFCGWYAITGLKTSQIIRLVGTTKPTIAAIRERTHWNSANLTTQDPVHTWPSSQIHLDMELPNPGQDAPLPKAQ